MHTTLHNFAEHKIRLLNRMSQVWQIADLPEQWKGSCTVPILKGGKPTTKQKFRRILLTSIVCKFAEMIAHGRLQCHLEWHNKLKPFKNGFI